jgi:hypothetical protein
VGRRRSGTQVLPFANPLAGEPDGAHDLVARYRNLDDPARADELGGRLGGYSRFGTDLDGGTADAADLEQPTFPPRDRDEEDGELPELPVRVSPGPRCCFVPGPKTKKTARV